jgi:DNA-binding Lrp family transcriptional regulator
MSWKVSKLVKDARLAGSYKDVPTTEWLVLREMADACRHDSAVASISMSELETLTGLSRSTMSRAVKGLLDKKCIRRDGYGASGRASKYAIQDPVSRSADVTCDPSEPVDKSQPRSADATWLDPQHVASTHKHVAPTHRARSAHATNPETELLIPKRAREAAGRRALIDACIRCDEYGWLIDSEPAIKCAHLGVVL